MTATACMLNIKITDLYTLRLMITENFTLTGLKVNILVVEYVNKFMNVQ